MEADKYYELVSDIIEGNKNVMTICDAIKMAQKLGRNFFEDMKGYLKHVRIENIPNNDFSELEYFVYRVDNKEHMCLLIKIDIGHFDDETKYHVLTGINDNGELCSIPEYNIIDKRSYIEENIFKVKNYLQLCENPIYNKALEYLDNAVPTEMSIVKFRGKSL